MLFARLENNIPDEFPISENELRKRLSHMTLPETLSSADLASTDYCIIELPEVSSIPAPTKDMQLTISGVARSGSKWVREYALTAVDDDLKPIRLASKWKEVRKKRDALMNAFDWRILRHARQVRLGQTPDDDIAVLDAYMAALADITNAADPFLVQFPEVPA